MVVNTRTAAFDYKRPFAGRSKDTVIIERSQIFLNGRILRGRFRADLGYFLGSKTFGIREGGKELFQPANKLLFYPTQSSFFQEMIALIAVMISLVDFVEDYKEIRNKSMVIRVTDV